MRSTDNGDTWEGLHPPKDGFINHITFYNNRFWIVMDNTVYKTTTLGDTWTAEAMAYDGLRSLSFAENNPYIYGWAVGGSGTVLHYSFDTTPVLPEISDGPPEHFVLYQNYPNPFNPETTIRYTLPSKSDVIIQIFNLLGKSVFSIEKQGCKAGTHRFRWDGRDDHHRSVESGLYFYRITTAFGTESLKMMLLK